MLNSQSEVPSESSLPTVDTHQVASSYGSHSASGQDVSNVIIVNFVQYKNSFG